MYILLFYLFIKVIDINPQNTETYSNTGKVYLNNIQLRRMAWSIIREA